MEVREKYIAQLMNDPIVSGLAEVRFIHTPQVFTFASVRLRCQYTCSHTRQSDTSPPHSPTHTEAREVLDEFKYGLLLRREDTFQEREARKSWQDFNETVIHIEGECHKRGYPRAFALAIGNCLNLHSDDRYRPCDFPGKSRPTLEAIGIELKDTFEMVHWQGYLTREPGAPYQLFALMLLE